MSTATYHFSTSALNGLFGHQQSDSLVYDFADDPVHLDMEAFAASGDCFEMLASNLDQVSRRLMIDSPEQVELEHVIRTLLYLQRHYALRRKLPRSDLPRF